MVKGWFFRELPSDKFFTCHARVKSVYEPIGPGDRAPTPKEVADVHAEGDNVWTIDYCVKQTDIKNETNEIGVELPSGCYTYASPSGGDYPERLIPIGLRSDTMVAMKICAAIKEDIQSFLDGEEIYRKIGIQYRRGILMYGPPGQGKTTIIRHLIRETFSDALVIFLNRIPSTTMLRKIREEEGDRLKVFVFEELAAVVNDQNIDRVLDFLDGESSLDNTIVLATTNYPDRLPKNIVDRPSRFDRLIKIGNPDKETRQRLLTLYLKRKPSPEEVKTTERMSAAALKEVALLHHLRGFKIEEAVEHLKKAKRLVDREFADTEETGFKTSGSRSYDDDEYF